MKQDGKVNVDNSGWCEQVSAGRYRLIAQASHTRLTVFAAIVAVDKTPSVTLSPPTQAHPAFGAA